MKWYIGNYTWTLYNKTIKEWYISDGSGNIVAGDFKSYNQARQYMKSNLLYNGVSLK